VKSKDSSLALAPNSWGLMADCIFETFASEKRLLHILVCKRLRTA
jgi:hypothetical protein